MLEPLELDQADVAFEFERTHGSGEPVCEVMRFDRDHHIMRSALSLEVAYAHAQEGKLKLVCTLDALAHGRHGNALLEGVVLEERQRGVLVTP